MDNIEALYLNYTNSEIIEDYQQQLNTRFGLVKIDINKKIKFPYGIIGLPEYKDYAVAEFPNGFNNFRLLQPLDDEATSFIVLPVNSSNYHKLIAQEDIEEACQFLGIISSYVLVMAILNIKHTPNSLPQVFANVRAPILIDAINRVGFQYIFSSNKYEISKPIS